MATIIFEKMIDGELMVIEKLEDEDLTEEEREAFEKMEYEIKNGLMTDLDELLIADGIDLDAFYSGKDFWVGMNNESTEKNHSTINGKQVV